MANKNLLTPLSLSKGRELMNLVENRKAYTMDHCELNIFETYQRSELVAINFQRSGHHQHAAGKESNAFV